MRHSREGGNHGVLSEANLKAHCITIHKLSSHGSSQVGNNNLLRTTVPCTSTI